MTNLEKITAFKKYLQKDAETISEGQLKILLATEEQINAIEKISSYYHFGSVVLEHSVHSQATKVANFGTLQDALNYWCKKKDNLCTYTSKNITEILVYIEERKDSFYETEIKMLKEELKGLEETKHLKPVIVVDNNGERSIFNIESTYLKAGDYTYSLNVNGVIFFSFDINATTRKVAEEIVCGLIVGDKISEKEKDTAANDCVKILERANKDQIQDIGELLLRSGKK